MAVKKFDKKYLSIFIDRFIPGFIKVRYPLYRTFIKAFLEYLEQDNNAWNNASNFIKFIDIDKIDAFENAELRTKVIDQIYKMFLGSEEARYLSTLMDEILFLKQQKNILKKKGTKAIFLLMLLYILNGYFRIENVDSNTKKHDGTFSYNGIITYGFGDEFIEAFVYLVISEFNLSQFETVMKYLNPSGMTYIFRIQKNFGDENDAYHKPNFTQYNGDWLLAIS